MAVTTTIFYTSICANYFGKALALAASLKEAHPDSRFVIGLVERDIPPAFDSASFPDVDEVILARELMPGDRFEAWIFRYSIVEAATAIKGILLKHLYESHLSIDRFVYLDPDTFVYSPLNELLTLLDSVPIIVTPHLEVPGNLEMELSALRHGVFNLGFLAVNRHPETQRFIDWWVARLGYACYDDIPNGIFTDQKWINLVPCFFPCNILRHPGYNFATWSLMDRKLTQIGRNSFIVNDKPLRFAHFSGFDSGVFHSCIERWDSDNRETLLKFADDYIKACDAQSAAKFKKISWSYGNYRSDKPISRLARVAWREIRKIKSEVNPFELGDVSILVNALRYKSSIVKIFKELIKRYA
jgi:hypothetical protein